jgi:hypothetical protein
MSHTPGPWYVSAKLSGSENDKGFIVRAGMGADRVWIADVSPLIKDERGEASEEGKANASLIAAAPAMFAALQHIYEQQSNGDHSRDAALLDAIRSCARDAVALAKGGTGEGN